MQTKPELKRQIGIRTATAMVIGEVIAIGIFLTPAGMAKSLASPFWLTIVWLLMGAMATCGALCYGELASRFPEAGGGYVYLREAFGRPIAFLYGWMTLFVMDPGLTAALAVGMAGYAGYIFKLSPYGSKALAVAAILFLAAANLIGVRVGAGILRVITLLKLGLLVSIPVWGFALRLGSWSNFVPFVERRAPAGTLLPALAGGMLAAFFSFGGWWDVTKVAGEIREPARNIPRALIRGIVIVTLVYILTSATFVYLVPFDAVTSGETFAAQAGGVLFGRLGGLVFATIVVVAVFGSLAAIIMSAPRVYFAMARDRLFIPALAVINLRFRTPARAITLQALLAIFFVILGSFSQIVSFFIFVVVIFIALTVASLFVLRRSRPVGSVYLTPGYPITPMVFLVLVALILFLLGSDNPRQAILGVGVVMLGIPVYYLFFREAAK